MLPRFVLPNAWAGHNDLKKSTALTNVSPSRQLRFPVHIRFRITLSRTVDELTDLILVLSGLNQDIMDRNWKYYTMKNHRNPFNIYDFIDISRQCQLTCYMHFIDYQKVFHKVDRNKLLSCLRTKINIHESNGSLMPSGVWTHWKWKFASYAGVHQGASTRCLLSMSFINPTLEAVAAGAQGDWLDIPNSLLLMGETVVFANSRERLFQRGYPTQTVHMRIWNGDPPIQVPIHSHQWHRHTANDDSSYHTITHHYVYMVTPVRAEFISAQVDDPLKFKSGHLVKFPSFLTKNTLRREADCMKRLTSTTPPSTTSYMYFHVTKITATTGQC